MNLTCAFVLFVLVHLSYFYFCHLSYLCLCSYLYKNTNSKALEAKMRIKEMNWCLLPVALRLGLWPTLSSLASCPYARASCPDARGGAAPARVPCFWAAGFYYETDKTKVERLRVCILIKIRTKVVSLRHKLRSYL
jgi:hypothetical protein